MSARGRRLILVALLVTLMLGATLYFLSQPTPRPVSNPLSATWWDDFTGHHQIYEEKGVFHNDGGVRLSHIHDLGSPVAGASGLGSFALASDGRLFGVAQMDADDTLHLFVYDPNTTQMSDLWIVAQRANVYWPLAVGSTRQEIYAGLNCWDKACDGHLLVYDLQSGQPRHIYLGFADNWSIVGNLVVASDDTVYGTVDGHIFSYTPTTFTITDLVVPVDEWEDIERLVLGDDGNLYGFTDYEGWFKYEPSSGQIAWILRWSEYRDRWLGKGINGKLYLVDGRDELLYVYDPISDLLVRSRADLKGLSYIGFDGDNNMYIDDWRELVRYNIAKDARIVLEDLRDYCCSKAIDTAGRIYLGRNGYETYHPIVEPPLRKIYRTERAKIARWLPPWAASRLPILRPIGSRRREYHPARLMVYQDDTFKRKGILTSRSIQPHALMVTRTEISNLNITSALAWGNDGALYGASVLGCRQSGWLFRYDPFRLEHVIPITVPVSCVDLRGGGALALTADSKGRLITGDGNGALIVYDPASRAVVTTPLSIPNARTVTALALAPDGLVYGGAMAGTARGPAGPSRLFVCDPERGTVLDLGTPFTNTWEILTLAVAPDGRVYGGGGPAGVVDTYYFGYAHSSGQRLFVYYPTTRKFDLLGPDTASTRRVRSLLVGPDGKVYIGMEFGNWLKALKGFAVYNSATGEWIEWDMFDKGNVVALAMGDDGLIYGSAISGWQNYLFTYDPSYPDHPPLPVGASLNRGITVLLPGSNGAMYGAVGNFNSYYYGTTELIAFRTDCTSGRVGAWERVSWEADTPRGTDIMVDVLNREGDVLLHDVQNGAPLWAIDPISNTTISLRATLSTHDERVTPVLKSWRVDYTFQCQE